MEGERSPSPARAARPALSLRDSGARPTVDDGATVVTLTPAGDAVIVCRGSRMEVHGLARADDTGAGLTPPTLVDGGAGAPPRAAALSPDATHAALLRGASVQLVAPPDGVTVAVLAPPPGAGDTLGVVWCGARGLVLIARDGVHAFAVRPGAGGASRAGRAPAHRVAWWASTHDGGALLLGDADGWVTPVRVVSGDGGEHAASSPAAARGAPFAPAELSGGGLPASTALFPFCGGVAAILAPSRAGGAAGVYALPRAASDTPTRVGGVPPPRQQPAHAQPPLFTMVDGLLIRLDPGHAGAVVADAPAGPSGGLRSARVAVGGLPGEWGCGGAGDDDDGDANDDDADPVPSSPRLRARRRSSGAAAAPRRPSRPPRWHLSGATLLDTRTGRACTLTLDARAAADALAGRAPSGARVAFFAARANGRAAPALAAAAWRALLRAPPPVGDDLAVAAAALAGGGEGVPPVAEVLASLSDAGVRRPRAAAAAAALGAALVARGVAVPAAVKEVVVGAWPAVVVDGLG